MFKVNMLITGDFNRGNSSNFIYEAFSGKVENCLRTEDETQRELWSDNLSLVARVRRRLRVPVDIKNHNREIKKIVRENKVNVVLIIKGNSIWPSTLKFLRKNGIKILSWSDDDMYNRNNRSLFYDIGLKYYDMVVTQKSYNCNPEELPSLGARKVFFRNKAFHKPIHKPYEGKHSPRFNHKVLFIGHYEKQRSDSIFALARSDIRVDVYGPGWQKLKGAHENVVIHNKLLVNEDYSEAISSSLITLCFLRKENRDLQTGRTMEIPACGGFMLGERSKEHLELFREGVEAEYFDGDEELVRKAKYYLENEALRQDIAFRGRKRCLREPYSYDDRAEEILSELLCE